MAAFEKTLFPGLKPEQYRICGLSIETKKIRKQEISV